MKYPFNGERLKKARIYRGLTVAELAQQVACQRQTLTMYELSKSQPADQSIVSSFAKILNFPESYFYEPTFNSAASAVYFRSLLTTSKKYRTEQAIKMEYLAQIFLMLQDYIQFPAFSPLYLPENILPEDAANNLRQHWNLGDGPLNNLISIVEEHGIFVSTFSSNTTEIDAFSELIHYEGKPTYLIAYSNNKVSAARVHFDIAHELGHIFLHEWSEDLDLLSKEEFKKRENEAHAFAAAFLLPANTFGRDASSGPQTITFYKTLKKKWKVSIAAMIRRAMSLQIMTPENYQFLIRQMQRRGQRKEEPLDDILVTEGPALLKSAVQILLQQDVFTPKSFMKELSLYGLSIYPSEVEMLLNLPEETLTSSKIIYLPNLQLKDK